MINTCSNMYADKAREDYINKYYENNRLVTPDELDANFGKVRVYYDELSKTQVQGYPFASGRDENGRLYFYFLPDSHELCVGTTGSGKTTGCVMPKIRALSSKKNKPFLFITDPKGEVFESEANHLKKEGYEIFLLNFKNPRYSHNWNPFAELYDLWMKRHNLFDKITAVSMGEISQYTLQDAIENFAEDEFYSYEDMAFPSMSAAHRYVSFEDSNILSDAEDLINQIVHTLITTEKGSNNDYIWIQGAQEILKGMIYLMLEDALEPNSGFTKENMSFMTMKQYYDIIRQGVFPSDGSQRQLVSTLKLRHKKYTDESIKHMKAFFENAPTTSRSYLGVFENAMQDWFTPKIYSICNGNTINLDRCVEENKPFAIFLITRDYEKSDFTVAGLFIDWVYRTMLKAAEENAGTLSREMFFILDEFGNIPAIRDFENKIATSRSRNIWFHMFVQSYAQIELVYDKEKRRSTVIRDNCNAQSFLGSQNYETKSTFSRECGKRVIPTLSAVLNPDVHQTTEVPLVPVSELELMHEGQMYVRRMGMPLIYSKFERNYACPEFTADKNTTAKEFGIESLPFNSEVYQYKYLSNDKPMKLNGTDEKSEEERLDFVSKLF